MFQLHSCHTGLLRSLVVERLIAVGRPLDRFPRRDVAGEVAVARSADGEPGRVFLVYRSRLPSKIRFTTAAEDSNLTGFDLDCAPFSVTSK